MAVLRAVMRLFSYFFHGMLAVFLLAVSVVALASGQTLHLDMLPWHGQSLTYGLFLAALAGLISVILAIKRRRRAVFFLWSLAVFAIMVNGFFFSRYHFAGRPEFHLALYLTGGALLAALGAWFQLRRVAPR